MDKSTHQIRCEKWTQIISQCIASGMTKAAWCEANGISEKSFFYWQRILRNEAYIDQKQLPATAASNAETPVAFVELKPAETASIADGFRPDAVIRCKSFSLELSNTVSPELLKHLGGLLHAE